MKERQEIMSELDNRIDRMEKALIDRGVRLPVNARLNTEFFSATEAQFVRGANHGRSGFQFVQAEYKLRESSMNRR